MTASVLVLCGVKSIEEIRSIAGRDRHTRCRDKACAGRPARS